MKDTAAGLASLGRGPDTMLVHMSPREVAGLQQLAMAHGGSLTTNPHTGLPEAGFLQNILPMLAAGIAVATLGPAAGAATGALGMGAAGTGAAAGALTGALTNRDNPLQGALMGGLGGYGIGGGMGAAMNSGLFGGTEAASAGITGGMPPVPGNEFLQSGVPVATDTPAAQLFGGNQLANPATFPGATDATPRMTMAPEVTASKPTFMQALGQQFDTPMSKAAAGIGAIGALGGFEQPKLGFVAPQQQASNYRAQRPTQRPYDESAPGGYYFTDRGIPQPVFAAKGGEMHSVPELEDGGFVLTKKAVDGLGKGDNKRGQRAASAGLGAIPIKGPGTGTSDSIPTTIDGKRPALLSNGEAYVPRDQVKRRGGAKKFYALMKQAEREAARRA